MRSLWSFEASANVWLTVAESKTGAAILGTRFSRGSRNLEKGKEAINISAPSSLIANGHNEHGADTAGDKSRHPGRKKLQYHISG